MNGCVQIQSIGTDRDTPAFTFRKAQPPRLQVKRHRPEFSVDIPKTEIRLGLRRVEQGVQLHSAIEPGEACYGWGEWFNAFQRQVRLTLYRTRLVHRAWVNGRVTESVRWDSQAGEAHLALVYPTDQLTEIRLELEAVKKLSLPVNWVNFQLRIDSRQPFCYTSSRCS